MLSSKTVQRLLHLLVVLVGAGLGVAATLGALQIYRWLRPADPLPLIYLGTAYILMALLGAFVFHLLSPRILKGMADATAAMERYLDRLSASQLITGCCGLVAGMLIAALLSQLLRFMGTSIFTTATSAILYVVLSLTGFSVGRRRSEDLIAMKDRAFSRSSRRKGKGEEGSPNRPRVLEGSSLVDGRILEICRLGFMEGELVLPECVRRDLTRMAESAFPDRRARGKRALEVLQRLQDMPDVFLRQDETPDLDSDAEAGLFRLARELDAPILSCDAALCRRARAARLTALNLNELADALRPAVHAGDEMAVQLVKEGREAGQGVGYTPDGAMIVVEGGGALLGQTVEVAVTSALQTSAGRMIFARLKDSGSAS